MSHQPIYVLRQHLGEVESLAFNERNRRLISGDNQGWIIDWDLERRRPSSKFQPTATSNGIMKVKWIDSTSDKLLVQSRGGLIQLFDGQNTLKDPITWLEMDYEGFCKVEMMQNSLFAAAAVAPSDVEIWDLENKTKVQTLSPLEKSKYGSCTVLAHCSDDVNTLLVGYESGLVAQWDVRNSKEPIREENCASSPVTCISLDSESKRAIIGSCDSFFCGVKLQGSKSVRKIKLPEEGLSSVSVREDRVLFATGGLDSNIRLWSFRTMEPLCVLKHHSQEVTSLFFSKSETIEFASGSRDGNIALWNIYSSKKDV